MYKMIKISKDEKIIHIKATSKRVAHKRRIKTSDKKEDINLRDGINNINLITKDDRTIEKILRSGNWNSFESRFFSSISCCRNVIVHSNKGEIYAMSKLQTGDKSVHISLLEVNPSMRREGYGIKAMSDIINTIIDSDIYDKIELTSLGKESDKFYEAIGMIKTNISEDYQSKYEGDKKWMKKFISISKKQ